MKIKHVLATAGAALAMAGTTATSAHATYDLTGGNYTSTSFSTEFQMNYARVLCSTTTLSGNTDNVVGETASTTLTPTFSNCTAHSGMPSLVARVSQPWKLTVTGPRTAGVLNAVVSTPDRTLVEFLHPIVVNYPELEPYVCKITIKTPVGGTQVGVTPWSSGAGLELTGASHVYESNGLCGTPASGAHSLRGTTLLPGVGIDEL